MRSFTKRLAATTAALALTTAIAVSAVHAGELDDGQTVKYYKSFPGKKVAFLAISNGMDIAQAIAAGLQRQSEDLGYTLTVRDYNWNIDQGAQALSQIISEKPDVLVLQNLDAQAFSSVIKRGTAEGVRIIQVQVKATANSDAYIGVDWYQIGYKNARAIAKACSTKAGKSGKIALMQGTPNNTTNLGAMAAVADMLKENPDITVVSKQAGEWDPTKAHGVVATVLKQNPDLCGYMGFWDGQDVGMAAAIKEAGLQGKIFTTSSGAAEKSTCQRIADGGFSNYVAYNIPEVVRQTGQAVATAIQQNLKAGTTNYAQYTAGIELNKDTLRPQDCWSVDDIKKQPWK